MTLRCSARNRVGLALPLRWAAPRCVPVDEEGTLCQRSSTNRRGRHNWSTTTCRGSGLEHGLQGAGLDRRARRRHQGRKPAKARDGADRHPLTPVSSRARCRSDGCPGPTTTCGRRDSGIAPDAVDVGSGPVPRPAVRLVGLEEGSGRVDGRAARSPDARSTVDDLLP